MNRRIINNINEGYLIWNRIKEKYNIQEQDVVLFFDIDNIQIAEMIEKSINDLMTSQEYKTYVIVHTPDYFHTLKTITISIEEMNALIAYYSLTLFHPRVRIASEKEPFDNWTISKNANIALDKYIKRSILKVF